MKLPSDDLPRVDGSMSNWTTQINISPSATSYIPQVFSSDDWNRASANICGRRVSAHRRQDDNYKDQE
jgi:hypothetical protein